ncbi:uncharacterized protein E0L32_008103 [Thyridium curvatum]|uniref:Uncharacterized protein n=1 Tax=Thyridium curvatum TaxID=1093900 RepID=A0A507ATV0_9PEZI|nr:uncharacterized protein E0L32_008103 [Thyridium curvatum]TPX10897.1 hypothetical protein E0L32_008103 [Thyridium curvatum]
MDYYSSSFAIHFLQLLYANLAGQDDPQRAAEFRSRAALAALDLAHYYDREGRAIPFGRSVGYRFAMCSFWGALAYGGVADLPAPLTWGMVKGIVMRHLRWWQTQGDMWSAAGTLTVGYSYPNMYPGKSPVSPSPPPVRKPFTTDKAGQRQKYWACLAFICLAVPESHPFWTSPEESQWDVLPPTKPLRHPGHITSYLGGHCMLLNSGQACGYPMKGTHAKYGAFAYSSAYAYSAPPGLFTLEQYALASQLGLSDDGGEYWKTRRLCEYAGIEDRPDDGDGDGTDRGSTVPVLVSVWRPFPDVRVKTYLVPPREATPNWHLRAHRVEAAGREVMTADGAFAIRNVDSRTGRYLGAYDPARREGTRPLIIGNYDTDTPEGWAPGRAGAFAASLAAGAVGIRALEGDVLGGEAGAGAGPGSSSSRRQAMLVNADPNSNLVESRTAIPTLRHTVPRGGHAWYVSAIYARPAGAGVPGETYLDGWDAVPEIPGWLREEMKSGAAGGGA